MTILQIALMALAILATIYQVVKIIGLHAMFMRAQTRIHITGGLYLATLVSVACQVAFVLSLTGINN